MLPLSGVILRLGGFHLLLSSMGSIGTIVAGKGSEASSMCTSISHLNETIIMRRTVLFKWWMDMHVLKAFAYICYQRGLLQLYYRSRPL